MKNWLLASAAIVAGISFGGQARADLVNVSFGGSGIYADLHLTVVPSDPQGPLTTRPNSNYPVSSFIVTAISGTFSDSTTPVPVVNAQITGIVAPTFDTARDEPPNENTLAPHSLSFYSASTRDYSYDNLYYPNGSPQTANLYPFFGGVLDIYGLLFTVEGGYTVNLWSNGNAPFVPPGQIYQAAVFLNGTPVDDRESSPLAVVPEPASMLLLGSGLLGLAAARRRSRG